MCGRFASYLPPDAMRSLFATVGAVPNLPPSWNVAPTNDAMVIRRHPGTGERRLDLLRWGLVPSWTEGPKAAQAQPINAAGAAAELMRPAGDNVLLLWPVSRAVNSVRNNGGELLDQVDDPTAPPPRDAPARLNPA